jgi:hypothetical protein
MSDQKPVVVRPIRWANLRADEALREIRRRLALSDPFISPHAFDRIDERQELGKLTTVHMLSILETGTITQNPRREDGGWVVVVEKRIAGCREAGVVTLIVHPGDDLEVWTVQWMDF